MLGSWANCQSENFTITNHNNITLRVRLDTAENWKLKLKTEKHCSKIIFKCVNSIVGPIFNEKVAKKYILWDPWTVHKNTVHTRIVKKLLLDKKKKKKLWNVNMRLGSAKRASQTHSKRQYLTNWPTPTHTNQRIRIIR